MPERLQKSENQRSVVKIMLIGALFAFAYSQSPFYTSNQNQYFLHGLARAGLGFLDQDWLASTLDPTPVFSQLIYLTARFFPVPIPLFISYYIGLMIVYLYCLVEIGAHLFPLRRQRGASLLFTAAMIFVHSFLFRQILEISPGINWAYIFEDGLADQRLLGPVFQPSTFGVFLLLSILLFLRKKPFLAALSAVLAATVHPTYLLSAGTLTLAYMALTYQDERRIGRVIGLGIVALVFISPILIYVYSNFANTPPETTSRAQEILVNFRIPHHAVVIAWFDLTSVFKIAWVIAAMYLVRTTRLFWIMAWLSFVAISLTILQMLTSSNALALIFPWRIFTVLVPLATAIMIAAVIIRLYEAYPGSFERHRRLLVVACCLGISFLVITGFLALAVGYLNQYISADREVINYVAANKSPGQVYLIPIKLQDFRLASGAPAYVEFKSIPYQDQDVLEWRRRVKMAQRFYNKADCQVLTEITAEGITHVITSADEIGAVCPGMIEIFSANGYVLYEVRA